eukprot:7301839-Prymnesium_polylepis.2
MSDDTAVPTQGRGRETVLAFGSCFGYCAVRAEPEARAVVRVESKLIHRPSQICLNTRFTRIQAALASL